jgi:hypothetical protein
MSKISDSRMVGFHVPNDEKLLAAFGIVSIRHGHLDHILRMTVKTLTGVSLREAMDALAFEGSASLRDRIKKLARQELGEGKTLVKVQALMGRAKRLAEARNALIHSVYAKELDGEAVMGTHDGTWAGLPKTDDVHKLAAQIEQLVRDINEARLHGYLHDELAQRRKKLLKTE